MNGYICNGVGDKVRSTDQDRMDAHILSEDICISASYRISEASE